MPRTMTENLKAAGLKQVLSYLDKDFETNAVKILDWLIKHDSEKIAVANQAQTVKTALQSKDNNWRLLLRKAYEDIDEGVRRRMFENFIINASLVGTTRQRTNGRKYGYNVPWAILMDPTSACNIQCIGCLGLGVRQPSEPEL